MVEIMRTGTLPKISEAVFLPQIIELAQTLGWLSAHFRPAMTAKGYRTAVSGDGKGFPDLMLARERVIYVELKSEVGKLDADQIKWRDRLLKAGEEWYCWRPSDFDMAVDILTKRTERR